MTEERLREIEELWQGDMNGSQRYVSELILATRKMLDELDYYRKLEVKVPTLRIVEEEQDTPMSPNRVRKEAEIVADLILSITPAALRYHVRDHIAEYVEEAVAAEREECAKLAEEIHRSLFRQDIATGDEALQCAAAIRARGKCSPTFGDATEKVPESAEELLHAIEACPTRGDKWYQIVMYGKRAYEEGLKDEREACAKIAEEEASIDHVDRDGYTIFCCEETVMKVAAAIRKRGEE